MEIKKERKLNIDKKKMNKAEWGDLPKDSVRLIMEKLVWSDKFRMSLICKSWQECLHEIENTQEFLPWVMSYDSSDQNLFGGICKLYDPAAKRSYIVEAPILKGASPRQSKNGWVLFSKPIFNAMCFFFYSPFNYEVIELPKAEKKCFRKIMFSLSPSSPDCMVITFSIPEDGKLEIQTCHPGDKSWKMFEFSGEYKHFSVLKLAYTDKFFYCIFSDRKMGAFNIKQQEWKVLSEPSPSIDYYYQYLFVAFNGDLILSTSGKLSFWRFDISNTKWEFVEDESLKKQLLFKDHTIYLLSVPAVGNAKEAARKIYTLHDDSYGCGFFYLNNDRQTFSKYYKWMEDAGRLQHIWIQPPFQSF